MAVVINETSPCAYLAGANDLSLMPYYLMITSVLSLPVMSSLFWLLVYFARRFLCFCKFSDDESDQLHQSEAQNQQKAQNISSSLAKMSDIQLSDVVISARFVLFRI